MLDTKKCPRSIDTAFGHSYHRLSVSRNRVFLSYAREDIVWKEKVVRHLNVLAKQDLIEIWDDRRVDAGEDWQEQILRAIDSARLAVPLISAHLLGSDVILNTELPRIRERHRTGELAVVPVIVHPCAWRAVSWLSRLQVHPWDAKPLSARREHRQEAELAAIAEEVLTILRGTRAGRRS